MLARELYLVGGQGGGNHCFNVDRGAGSCAEVRVYAGILKRLLDHFAEAARLLVDQFPYCKTLSVPDTRPSA
jgi:hypothetical protein